LDEYRKIAGPPPRRGRDIAFESGKLKNSAEIAAANGLLFVKNSPRRRVSTDKDVQIVQPENRDAACCLMSLFGTD
jgi:hypothetical protein